MEPVSNRSPECIPGRPERLSVPRGIEDKCGDNIFLRLSLLRLYWAGSDVLPLYIKTVEGGKNHT